MNQKVALVTGGARGIGRHIALGLAQRGWSIAIAYRGREDDAAATVGKARARGAQAVALRCDVSRPEDVERWVRQAEAELGAVEALVHAAGSYHRVALLSETAEGWRAMFDDNLHSLFYCAKAVAPGMIERRRGRILAFSMAGADRPRAQTHVTAHFIAKMGVQALVRSLARSLAPHGITANCISPGFIDTGDAEKGEPAIETADIPAGRLGTLDDPLGVALFLLSDEAAYVNGADIVLSGAWGV